LVEAADDICYRIIDIEDGYELGYLKFAEARDILGSIASDHPQLSLPRNESDQIGKLRAVAVGLSIDECIRVFIENKDEILVGHFGLPLIELTKYSNQMHEAEALAKQNICRSETVTKREIAAAKVITGLLDMCSNTAIELTNKNFDVNKLDGQNLRMARIMGNTLRPVGNAYEAMRCVTDFVSGMTDRFALETYRTLTGIST
jgi:dGTPase